MSKSEQTHALQAFEARKYKLAEKMARVLNGGNLMANDLENKT